VSYELTETAILFLRKIFSLYSRNGEELSSADLDKIFYPCPEGTPKFELEKYVRRFEEEDFVLTKTEWYIFWAYMTYN
jgi:Ca2+-binding EF-hand superfamily protein